MTEEMDLKNIKRRDRRFYRSFDENKVHYTERKDVPADNYSMKVNIDSRKLRPISGQTGVSDDKKKIAINKIIKDMSKIVNPDTETIAEMIYEQMKQDNIKTNQEQVAKAVENSTHFRSSRRAEDGRKQKTSTGLIMAEKETISIESDNESLTKDDVKSIIEDVYDQFSEEDKKSERKATAAEKREDKKKEIVVAGKQDTTKDKESKKKDEAKTKQEKKEEMNFEEENDDKFEIGDNEGINDDSDELGLKF